MRRAKEGREKDGRVQERIAKEGGSQRTAKEEASERRATNITRPPHVCVCERKGGGGWGGETRRPVHVRERERGGERERAEDEERES